MPLRLAIIGLDPFQREWLEAVSDLCAAGEVELVGIGHRTLAAAKDVADVFRQMSDEGTAGGRTPPTAPRTPLPAFDDLRLLLKESAPQIVLMDRPVNAALEFLLECASREIGVLSLGPPVESLAEAQALAAVLERQTRLLYIWPRFSDAPASRHCAQADDYVRPIRFVAATWLGINHALAKVRDESDASRKTDGPRTRTPGGGLAVRSLSVLAWDVFGTLIRLMDMPTSVYAAVRGTVGTGNSFADFSGAASVTMRFPDDATASIALCDHAPLAVNTQHTLHGEAAEGGDGGSGAARGESWDRRNMLIWGGGGMLRLSAHAYEFRDPLGHLLDEGPGIAPAAGFTGVAGQIPSPRQQAGHTLREFLRHYQLPPSPHRGWEHRLEEIAATMEALMVSQRTGEAESPDRLRSLRR